MSHQHLPQVRIWPFVALFTLFFANTLQAQNKLSQITESLKKNVIAIRASFEEGESENGFGFIVGEQNNQLYFVTAAHVVRGPDQDKKAQSIKLKFYNDIRWYEASFLYHWDKEDLALLELTKPTSFTNWRRDCADLQLRMPQNVRFIGINDNEPSWVDPGLDGNLFQDKDPELNFAISTIRPGTSGAPLITEKGIVGMITKDDADISTALKLTQIQKLLNGGGQYNYFGLREPGETNISPNPGIQNQPILANKLANDDYGLVLVKGGTFTMGCTTEQGSDCRGDEKPAHKIVLSDFYIGQYEVTQAQWQAVMGRNPSRLKNCDQCPVEGVSWDDIQQFLRKINNKTGKQYRLPTEAEWEYAARGGNQSLGYKYAGGNYIDDVAWYDLNAGGKTHPVGQKKPNELGLYDMSGNVWEGCQDWYGAYSSETRTDPTGAVSGTSRVFRGGGGTASGCRVSCRYGTAAKFPNGGYGFRLAL